MRVEDKISLYLMEKYQEIRFVKKHNKDPRTIEDVDFYYDIGHAQGAFVKKDDQVYLLIMGSNEWKDWFYNFWFFAKKVKPYNVTSNIRVHIGFYKSYLYIRDLVHLYIKSNNVKSLIVMGQSHGAAVTVLASLDIKYNFEDIDIAAVLTGCPRAGNDEFAKSYEKRIDHVYRFKYGCDLITKLPPKFFGFADVGPEMHVGPKDTFWRNLTIIRPILDHMLAHGMIKEFKKRV